jgi:hypothetical protein
MCVSFSFSLFPQDTGSCRSCLAATQIQSCHQGKTVPKAPKATDGPKRGVQFGPEMSWVNCLSSWMNRWQRTHQHLGPSACLRFGEIKKLKAVKGWEVCYNSGCGWLWPFSCIFKHCLSALQALAPPHPRVTQSSSKMWKERCHAPDGSWDELVLRKMKIELVNT